MSELNDKLLEIKRQKDEYILPENLKKDVTVYGVTGTLEPGSGGGDVKLFDTVEHMQEDEDAQDGDLAVVYREEIQPVTEESEFDSCIFSNTVVLNEAFTDNIFGSFRNTGSGYFEGYVELSSSNFRFSGYGRSGEIRVQYESQDGITYTRTDGGEELVEFGVTIKYAPYEPWNDVIGNFMKIGGNYFEGLYKYDSSYISTTDFGLLPISGIDITNSTYTGSPEGHYDKVKLGNILKSIKTDLDLLVDMSINITTIDGDLSIIFFVNNDESYVSFVELCYNRAGNYYQLSNTMNYPGYVYVYKIDLDTETYTLLQKTEKHIGYDWTDVNGTINSVFARARLNTDDEFSVYSSVNSYIRVNIGSSSSEGSISFPTDGDISKNLFYANPSYVPASMQLDAKINDILPNKSAYSKNGIIVGNNSIYDNLDWSTDIILNKIPSNLFLEYNNANFKEQTGTNIDYILSKGILNCDKPNVFFGIGSNGNISGYVSSVIQPKLLNKFEVYCNDVLSLQDVSLWGNGVFNNKFIIGCKGTNSSTNLIELYILYYDFANDLIEHKNITTNLPSNISGTFQFCIDEYDKCLCIGNTINNNSIYSSNVPNKIIYKLNLDNTVTILYNGDVNSLITDGSNTPSQNSSFGTVVYNNIVYFFIEYWDSKYNTYIRLYKIDNGNVSKLYGAEGSNTGGTRDFYPSYNAWTSKVNSLIDGNLLYFMEYAAYAEKFCKLDLSTGVITELANLNYGYKNGREYDNKSMFKYGDNIYIALMYNPTNGSSSSAQNYKICVMKYNITNNTMITLDTADFINYRGDEGGRILPLIENSHLYFNSAATCVDIDLSNDNIIFSTRCYHSGKYDYALNYPLEDNGITYFLNCGDKFMFKFENKQLIQNKLDGIVLISSSSHTTSPIIYTLNLNS